MGDLAPALALAFAALMALFAASAPADNAVPLLLILATDAGYTAIAAYDTEADCEAMAEVMRPHLIAAALYCTP